jgi:ABC-type sugar transport system substrate-binding protein
VWLPRFLRSHSAKSAIAVRNAQDALAKYPDLEGMVGIYGHHGPAILTAVRGAGRAKQVKIVCFDEHSDTLDGIAAGDIYDTIVQKPMSLATKPSCAWINIFAATKRSWPSALRSVHRTASYRAH